MQGIIADIGGTNARFAAIENGKVTREIIFKCDSYPTFEKALETYIDQSNMSEIPKLASISIAGPVSGDVIHMTNHPWTISISAIKGKFGFEYCHFMNDFEAIAFGVPYVGEKYTHKLGSGEKDDAGNIAVIGPGTGLGCAFMINRGDGTFRAVAGEWGHVTMPARTQREFDIIDYLQHHKYSHVSAERVCSGKGLLNLYDTLRVLDNRMDLPALLPEEITAKAIKKECAICEECFDLMLRFLARIAGNMALQVNAYGGVYIAGGIVPKIMDQINTTDFRHAFESKGRYRDYMKRIPIYVITHPNVAYEGLKRDILEQL